MAEDIRSAVKSFAKNEKLLKILPKRGDNAYETLIAALKYGSGQTHLVDLMEETELTVEELTELEDELNGSSRRCSCSTSDFEGDTSLTRPVSQRTSSRLRVPSQLAGLKPIKKRKSRQKLQHKQAHKEELPGISHLLPYVIPHIIKKWQLLATALGLSQEDIASITVAPHEKQSRCADMVLQKWLVKDKSRATRQKLVNALKEIDARKALEAISIYEVPKFKAKGKRKTSTGNIAIGIVGPAKLPSIVRKTSNGQKNSLMQLSSAIRRSGHLPIRCDIERMSSNDFNGTVEHSQKAFVDMATTITSCMVEQGEHHTQILNTVERLQGIIFHRVYQGSVILETQVMHLLALDRLMKLYNSDELVKLIEQVLVTEELLAKYNMSEVRMTVEILSADYEECRRELLALVNSDQRTVSETEFDSCFTSEQEDSGEERSMKEEENSQFIDNCVQLIEDMRCDLSSSLAEFDKEVSELLMTLQLVHPPTFTRISTMEDFVTFKGYVSMHTPRILSTASIDHFLDLHQQFVDKITSLRYKISAALFVSKTNEGGRVNGSYQQVEAGIEQLIAVERMLQSSYDFSSLTHPQTLRMTTLETLCYRGLLACHYVILDKLADAQAIILGELKH
ncbi:uncharacterized protein [Watersipora subatra]|uniref:uncharacterized protein n=1 Tax=Watersipora subatra TaxID=2589382 RepID=UPI00355C78C1